MHYLNTWAAACEAVNERESVGPRSRGRLRRCSRAQSFAAARAGTG
jgi:hypothetical protein